MHIKTEHYNWHPKEQQGLGVAWLSCFHVILTFGIAAFSILCRLYKYPILLIYYFFEVIINTQCGVHVSYLICS